MSKKKKSPGEKNKSKLNRNKIFQVTAIIIFCGLAGYFMYTNFLNSDSKEEMSTVLKNYNAFDFKKEGELTFISKENDFISKIDIEIAEDDNSRRDGLMYRSKMSESQGMFFIFPNETFQSFWMRNTPLPLDMIFVNKKNEIVTIRKNAVPFDESSYTSTAPALYVIEVNAGYTDKFGIEEGNKITWRRL